MHGLVSSLKGRGWVCRVALGRPGGGAGCLLALYMGGPAPRAFPSVLFQPASRPSSSLVGSTPLKVAGFYGECAW